MTSHDFVNSGSGNRCMLVPFFFSSSSRQLGCNAICGSSARKRKGWREGGECVP